MNPPASRKRKKPSVLRKRAARRFLFLKKNCRSVTTTWYKKNKPPVGEVLYAINRSTWHALKEPEQKNKKRDRASALASLKIKQRTQ